MSRQQVAVARLELSRARLRLALIDDERTPGRLAHLVSLVQRHPVIAAALAALVGGMLTRMRPWRVVLEPKLWTALLPSLLAVLAGMPTGGWLDTLAQLLRQATAGGAPGASSATTAPPR
jgi:hypothetical protein